MGFRIFFDSLVVLIVFGFVEEILDMRERSCYKSVVSRVAWCYSVFWVGGNVFWFLGESLRLRLVLY